MRVSGPRAPLHGTAAYARACFGQSSPRASHWSSVRYPGAAASRKACGRPAPMPRRRASIAASISAAVAGGALRYRASSSGAPARNWITSPSGADRAASAIRASTAWASRLICAGVNSAGTGMSCPASSSRASGCRSCTAGPAGRAVRLCQYSGQSVASTSTGRLAGSRSSARSPAATCSPSPSAEAR